MKRSVSSQIKAISSFPGGSAFLEQMGRLEILLTRERLVMLRKALGKKGPLSRLYHELVERAEGILRLPLLERSFLGRRMLPFSREALSRLTCLALVYRVNGGEPYRQRLESELRVLCGLPDWNPDHFLDTAEMALAVALPLNWVSADLPEPLRQIARQTLVEKALVPGLNPEGAGNWWWNVAHNWNPVCHSGLLVAAFAVAEAEPDLASRVCQRALHALPLAHASYGEGAYVEGPSYWLYGTSHFVLALDALESALGECFGLDAHDGFRRSFDFSLNLAGPGGGFFNYFDSNEDGFLSLEHLGLLAWKSRRTGQPFPEDAWSHWMEGAGFLNERQERHAVFSLLQLVELGPEPETAPLNRSAVAGGDFPVAVLATPDPKGIYLACKGGCGADNHGNLDAGSFILEWGGVRWSVDPGNQSYPELEAILGVDSLWDISQDSPRWSLLTKSNFGHSVLTVNDCRHHVRGRVRISDFDLEDRRPWVRYDLTPLYGDNLEEALRCACLVDTHTVEIQDQWSPNARTECISWQMITCAKAEIRNGGFVLRQSGREMSVEIREHSGANPEFRIVPLSPPPLPYDKPVPGLKRLEIRMRSNAQSARNPARLRVRLIGGAG